AIRARTPYGLRGMWGMTADQIAGVAMRRARIAGQDPNLAWAEAAVLIAALKAAEPMVRMQPTPFSVCGPDGPAILAVKGTCCLFYRTHDHYEDRRFCMNCPLLTHESRRPRVVEFLQREQERLAAEHHRA